MNPEISALQSLALAAVRGAVTGLVVSGFLFLGLSLLLVAPGL